MIKYTLSLLLFTFTMFNTKAQDAPKTADEIVNDAVAQAKKEHKKVFIMFHASWCIWCKRMDAAMNDASCKDYFDKSFVTEHVDILESKDKVSLENPGGMELFAKYGGGEKDGIPFWLILDENGQLLTNSKFDPKNSGELQNIGCPGSDEEINYFISLLKKYTDINAEQEKSVFARFKKVREK